MHPMANLLCLVAFDSEAPSGQSRITLTSKEPVNNIILILTVRICGIGLLAAIERFDLKFCTGALEFTQTHKLLQFQLSGKF